jgi:DNA-binding response OmpR family regulator
LASDALRGLRILILEDEFLIAMDVEQLCREEGADDVVIMRSLAETGGALAVAQRFDVAILDLMLDGASTLDFARDLQERDLPFVFASGYTDLDDIFSAFPGIAVVGKPYAGADLMHAVIAAASRAG